MSDLENLGGIDALNADVQNRVNHDVQTVPRLYAEALIAHVKELEREKESELLLADKCVVNLEIKLQSARELAEMAANLAVSVTDVAELKASARKFLEDK